MKRKAVCLLLALFFFLASAQTPAAAEDDPLDFSEIFADHSAVILLVAPENGRILYANDAASSFYGFSKDDFVKLNISDINAMNDSDIVEEIQKAAAENRDGYIFQHRLANGEVRDMEVYSDSVSYHGRDYQLLIAKDISVVTRIKAQQDLIKIIFFVAFSAIILILLLLVLQLAKSSRKIRSINRSLNNFNALRKTFIDANDNMIYLKDENLRYLFVNKAFAEFFHVDEDGVIGKDDAVFGDAELTELRHKNENLVLERQSIETVESEWRNKVFHTIRFPVQLPNGGLGVGAYIREITKEREREKRQEAILRRNAILVDVLDRSFRTPQEQLDYVLHEAVKLTESEFGYLYLYDESDREFIINSWTKGVEEICAVQNPPPRYKLENTGIWGEAVRQRKPIIVNDFTADHPLKKGLPEGHVPLHSFMTVPVVIDNVIKAVVGFANKKAPYDDIDVYETTVLLSGMWNSVERREALDKLTFERNKYWQTLISIGDGVMVIDNNGKIEMLNKVAQQLTGWTAKEAVGRHYRDVLTLSQENSPHPPDDPIEKALKTDTVQELENYAILTARDGARYHLEDSAAPIKDDSGATVGVVLVFRDVTEKKLQHNRIKYLSFHDELTGLYNRRFFEEELQRLDNPRNLPISIIMGDVNGLKLTNDVFGHAYGDLLLQKIADTFRAVCRSDDIIARWGGDEFVILLPKTDDKEATDIVERIKENFAQEKIKAIRGSISMGIDTKREPGAEMLQILTNAEERMYAAKAMEQEEIRYTTIDTIIETLHRESDREKEHSIYVSRLCLSLGRLLNLPADEMYKLKEAGYLHDIGKITLDPSLLNKNYELTDREWNYMRRHSLVGYRILNSFDDTVDLAESVLAHHERWDGTGYPKGLRGEEIPKTARIIAIAESYDRMIHHSANRAAMTKEQALAVILENGGSQFDPVLAACFVEMIKNEPEV